MESIGDDEIARPTKYRISTITATGRVNADLDLDLLFNTVANIIIDKGVGKTEEHIDGIVYKQIKEKRRFFVKILVKQKQGSKKS